MDGRLIKGIGGFYYVETADAIYECKARGKFRKEKITPLVGDFVSITVNNNAENTIDEIKARKNQLVRPPLANLDQLFIVASVVDPIINTFVLDRLIAIAEFKNIEPVIVITKTDLDSGYKKYYDLYTKAGFKVICCNNTNGDGAENIKNMLSKKTSAFTGNTGVGKSTLLNIIDNSLNIETGETSKKLGRGRHTTRHCQLYNVGDGYIADTPGFSAVDFERCEKILKDDLPYCFREFAPYIDNCKFNTSCTHVNDKGCAVAEAVKTGLISKERHKSYIELYNEVKDIKKWEMK
ncbi:MAG: ribosome small subunit-dependent GTPase A [Acetobacter sp.]|nr:ribosome small subunit-dependent GTPase A [Bacteroides sp.]MCM1340529.1 ribosome small subunit-dependent GTPase A [Acetobacter sp.]MCM1433269.1 ribosome small subunit-dependent GTPase A [Clostridiales bacterium]